MPGRSREDIEKLLRVEARLNESLTSLKSQQVEEQHQLLQSRHAVSNRATYDEDVLCAGRELASRWLPEREDFEVREAARRQQLLHSREADRLRRLAPLRTREMRSGVGKSLEALRALRARERQTALVLDYVETVLHDEEDPEPDSAP